MARAHVPGSMRTAALTALAVLIVDQASKIWVVHVLDLQNRIAIDVLPPWFNLRMAWNSGVNFGLFASDSDVVRWVLVALALVISAAVWLWVRREGARARISAGLLVGGALGNVIDRIVHGAVADFINMSCCGIDNPFAFNVADAAIFAGAVGLVLFTGSREGARSDGTDDRRGPPG